MSHPQQEEDGQHEGEHHVRVEGIEDRAAVEEVEGDLGNGGEGQHPQEVSLPVMGPGEALRDLEGEDGEGDAADVGQQVRCGGQSGPEVVAEHQGHGQELQPQGAETAGGGLGKGAGGIRGVHGVHNVFSLDFQVVSASSRWTYLGSLATMRR